MRQTFVDQMGRSVQVETPPRRIVSLVPSQTELLHTLGLEKEVVGITKFCELPATWHKHKPRVGGTKNVRLDAVHNLKPNLIIGNKEENNRSIIQELSTDYPVWMSQVVTLQDAYAMIQSVGELVCRETAASRLVPQIQQAFSALQGLHGKRVAYFIWKKPYMVAGSQTFIHTILNEWGAENVFGFISRYPTVSPEDIKTHRPEWILLSSEPYPFKERHKHEFQKLVPEAKVIPVDGKAFSWYGSRLLETPEYLNALRG